MKILMPIDGSDSSKHAMVRSLERGLLTGSEVHVFTVIPDKITARGYRVNPEVIEHVDESYEKHAKEILAEAERIFEKYHMHITTKYKKGDAAKEILDYADAIKADLIIIGNRGLGAFSKTLLGSVSSKVLSQSKSSVLVVKEGD